MCAKKRKKKQRRRRRQPVRSVNQSPQPSAEEFEKLEDAMLQRWINTPMEGPGSPTPKELAQTPEGRRELLEMFEEAEKLQQKLSASTQMHLFNYRKVRKMLGLD